MKQFKGTPGEWYVDDPAGEWVVDNNKNVAVAKVTRYMCDADCQRSNARLIAAAPELLEALQEIMIKFGHVGDASTWSISESVEGVKARAAIAKALGE